MNPGEKWHSTTIVCVRHNGKVAMASDGQVTLGTTIMKKTAAKIRRLAGGDVIAGFAGSSADAFALFSRFEAKLDEYRGNLERAAIELAKDWRTDKMLRQLEALLIVADRNASLLLSGTGDLISPEEGILAVGSGGPYALAAARALLKHCPNLSAAELARESLLIAGQIDIYTNDSITLEEL
jgi:ATP-dependent HslUV protease subunit HslV